MKWEVQGKIVEAKQGDIAKQEDIKVVVNAANAELQTGGGVAGVLHRTAGPELAEAGKVYAPIQPGEAVVTPAFQLPNKKVIHCLGPVYGRDEPAAQLLKNCYINALRLAEEEELQSIVFPALSTGAFGYPFEEAMKLAVESTIEEMETLQHVRQIRFLLFSEKEAEKYRHYLSKILAAT